MDKLNTKMHEKKNDLDYSKFEKIFGRYYDNGALGIGVSKLMSFLIMVITIVVLITAILLKLLYKYCLDCCNCCCKWHKKSCIIFSLIYTLLNMIIYLDLAFERKVKLDLTDEEIYIYDGEFNEEIRKNLKFMYERRIYLLVYTIFVMAGAIAQLIIIIIFREPTNKINENNIPHPENIIAQENDKPKNSEDIDIKVKQDL